MIAPETEGIMNVEDRRSATRNKLAALGCAVVTAVSDRRSGSYAVGFADGRGYFTGTWDSEAKALDWAAGNLPRIERYVLRGEAIDPGEFVLERVAEAAQAAGEDGAALREALEGRWAEIRVEGRRTRNREVADVLDDVECGDVPPRDLVARLAQELGLPDPTGTPAPR